MTTPTTRGGWGPMAVIGLTLAVFFGGLLLIGIIGTGLIAAF